MTGGWENADSNIIGEVRLCDILYLFIMGVRMGTRNFEAKRRQFLQCSRAAFQI